MTISFLITDPFSHISGVAQAFLITTKPYPEQPRSERSATNTVPFEYEQPISPHHLFLFIDGMYAMVQNKI